MSLISYCLLRGDSGASYVGATKDMEHRLRQHNGEIKGGAHYTTAAVSSGHSWDLLCNVSGFPSWQATLQFEWRWKQISRKKNGNPAERRIYALIDLVNMDRPTSKAAAYSEYGPVFITIYKECSETELLRTATLVNALIV
jgi:structure-specific endonuclease subunit SLX1